LPDEHNHQNQMYSYNKARNGNAFNRNRNNNSGNFQKDLNLKLGTHTVIEGVLTEVFGNSHNQYGQSLAVKFEDATLVDGCLYRDTDKPDRFKTFSWEDVLGMEPSLDFEVSPDDANRFLSKTYATTQKKYELVDARVPPLYSEPDISEELAERAENGDSEAAAEINEILDEFEPEELRPADPAEPIPIGEGNIIMWYSGNSRTGPKSASKTLAQVLTEGDVVVRNAEGKVNKDVFNWLADTSRDNLVRSDLEGRRIALTEVARPSIDPETGEPNGRFFSHAVVFDAKTGEEVYPERTDEQAEFNSQGQSQPAAPATDGGQSRAAVSDLPPKATGATEYPEPLADFIESCQQLGYDQAGVHDAQARQLLMDLIADQVNPLTQELVDEHGGVDAVLAATLQ
jgi:hypothetical protein